jgi:hypothetical protein
MSETTLPQASETRQQQPALAGSAAQQCEECLGSGGWFRYEPALEPSPGLLYLSCLQCRGSGRLALARA